MLLLEEEDSEDVVKEEFQEIKSEFLGELGFEKVVNIRDIEKKLTEKME